MGFNQIAFKFERDLRFAGEVKYTFAKSFALAINGLVSFFERTAKIVYLFRSFFSHTSDRDGNSRPLLATIHSSFDTDWFCHDRDRNFSF